MWWPSKLPRSAGCHLRASGPGRGKCVYVCVCVCVVVPSILSAGFHLWGAPAGVTQEEGQHAGDFYVLFVFSSPPSFCGACLFLFYREEVSAITFPRRPRSRIFCVPTTKSLSTVGCCARKNPRSLRDLNPRPNRQKVTRLPCG